MEDLFTSCNDDEPILTRGQYRRLQEQVESAIAEAKRAEVVAAAKRADAVKMGERLIKVTELLQAFGALPEDMPIPEAVWASAALSKKPPRNYGHTTWPAAITAIVETEPDGISFLQIKRQLAEGEFRERLEKSDKGFYTALAKLDQRNVIVRHKGHAFTPAHFARFEREVKSGVRQDVEAIRPTYERDTPLTTGIIDIIGQSDKPVKGADILKKIVRLPNVGSAIQRNPTGAYNVLSRLVRQGRLIKNETEKTYRLPAQGEIATELPRSGNWTGEEGAAVTAPKENNQRPKEDKE